MAFESFQSRSAAPTASFPALLPDEEESVLGKLGRQALSGLGFVGQTLDKPGRTIRGLLGGQGASALANLLPFSDSLGITDPTQGVTGRNLLEKAGFLDKGVPGSGLDAGDVAGFGLDVLTDPLMYVNPLSFTKTGLSAAKLGKATTAAEARATGKLFPTISERMGAGQQSLARIGLPWPLPHEAGIDAGMGPTSQAIGNKLTGLGQGLLYSKPGVVLSNLFDTSASLGSKQGGTVASQKLAREINADLPAKIAESQMPFLEQARLVNDAGQMGGNAAHLRSAVENAFTGPLQPESQTAVDFIKRKNELMRNAELDAGLTSGYRENYAPRHTTPTPDELLKERGRPAQQFSMFGNEDLARQEMFDVLPSTKAINELSTDPLISGVGPKSNLLQEAGLIRGKIPAYDATEHTALEQLVQQGLINPADRNLLIAKQVAGNASPRELQELGYIKRLDQLKDIESKSHNLADYIANLSPRRSKEGLELFGNNLFVDEANRAASSARKVHIADKLTDALKEVALPAGQAGQDAVRLTDTLKEAGFSDDVSKVMMQKLGITNFTDYKALHVPADIHDAVTRLVTGFTKPEATKTLLSAIDTMTNMFKIGVTTFWPARYTRNLIQQVWQMFVGGHGDPRFAELDPSRYLQPMKDAQTLLRDGGVIDGAGAMPYFQGRNLTDAEASRELQNMAFAHKVAGPQRMTREADIAGSGAHAAQANIQLPGQVQPGIGEIAKSAVPTSIQDVPQYLKDLPKIRGVLGNTETVSKPVAAGREADAMIDDWTRGGSFISLIRQGYAPDEAVKQAMKFQYNYGDATQFEKSVMKRVVPFWQWSRENVPAQLKQLAEKPGGATAQGIRLANSIHQQEGFLPPYLQDTLALPLGGRTPEGTQRFLTSLGLPFEDAFNLAEVGHGSATANAGHSLARLMSETNPLIKAPLEIASGQQFSSGRQLSDLSSKGLTGNILADQALMNSPASKALTTVRQIMDERKGPLAKVNNLFSPAKITDVDMNNQREIEARNMVEDYLKQNPNIKQFQRLYVPRDKVADLKPEDVAAMRLETSLIQRQEEAALARQAAAGDANAAHKLQLLKARRAR